MSDPLNAAVEPAAEPRATVIDRARGQEAIGRRPVPLIGFLSLVVALLALVLVTRMDSAQLSHSHKGRYYLSTLSAEPRPRKIRIGSFNIRYAPRGPLRPLAALVARALSPDSKQQQDGHARWGEAKWEERRERLVDQVLFHELDIVGFQEVLDHQQADLEVLMGDEFEHVGVGRDDGKKRGEAVPIFFRKSRYRLESVRHSWLSPTPGVPGSKGWDAGQPRMVTIARLRDLEAATTTTTTRTPRGPHDEIIVANTHWDDRGLEARTESARLILELVGQEARNVTREENGREPLVVLLGDLNSPAEEAGYQVLTGDRYTGARTVAGESSADKTFWDSRHEIATRKTSLGGPGALSCAYGPLNTFTGFVPSDVPKVIDFVLVLDTAAFVSPGLGKLAAESTDATFLDADSPDEVLASIPDLPEPATMGEDENSSTGSTESLLSGRGENGDDVRERQTRWKVSRYGVVPNFSEDVGGKRGTDDDSAVLVSDHRLVVVALEEVVA